METQKRELQMQLQKKKYVDVRVHVGACSLEKLELN